jgi:hypothetical protein
MDQLYVAELKMGGMQLMATGPNQNRSRTKDRRDWRRLGPVMRAALRKDSAASCWGGADICRVDKLPTLKMSPLPGDPSRLPWPDGDLFETKPLPTYIDRKALDAAADYAF